MKSGYYFYGGQFVNKSRVTLSSFNGLIEAPDAFTAFNMICNGQRMLFEKETGNHPSTFHVQIDAFNRVEDAE